MKNTRLSVVFGVALALTGVFAPLAALARPPVVLDYHSNVSATSNSRTFSHSESHRNVILTWTPLADTGLCELDLQLFASGTLTSGTIDVMVIASPSTPFFYSFKSDFAVDYTQIGTAPAFKTWTFYENTAVALDLPQGVTEAQSGGSDLTPGTCPVMYGGHEYWIYFQPKNIAGANVSYKYWGADISQYTGHAWYRGDLGTFDFNMTSELDVKAYGYGTFFGLPGEAAYENADPAEWVTSASYNFSNADYGVLGNMFRDVVIFLFYPLPAVQHQWNNLTENFSTHVPFAYVAQTNTLLQAAAIASASPLTIDFPVLPGTVATMSWSPVADLQAHTPTGWWAAVMDLMKAVIWLSFLYMVYNQGKSLFNTH